MTGSRPLGPQISDKGVTFQLWAPGASNVALLLDGPHPMRSSEDGWYELTVPSAAAGTRYSFRVDDDVEVPDPCSAFQPDGIGGSSEVIGHDYAWKASAWTGRPWHECVFLELHVGSFTPEGTFRAIIDKLDHLVDTGITAIELMPIADFAGRWNWGYDGVLPFAPTAAYGRPDDLKALIDAAHLRGLMVFLDVVYNHFGPEGNHLGRYAPSFFTEAQTPWGSAIDFRVPQVRAFAIENAFHWLRDYRFDGLRLDAVHAIVEQGEPSVLTEISRGAGGLATSTGRHIHLVLENDDNRPGLLDPVSDPPRGQYRAQWNDDYHHAWHVLLTGERHGYYSDYRDAGQLLARTLASGFAYQGEPSPHRQGALRGEPSHGLPATAFVNFLQNHDQIGNRALGERLTVLASAPAIEAALAVTLLAPMPPMLFMGEEWGATEPFPFFCDFKGDLAEAVRQGRKKEFAEAYADSSHEVPDPLSEDTLRMAGLDWSKRDEGGHRRRLDLVRRLLHIRKTEIVPFLPELEPGGTSNYTDGVLTARWRFRDGRVLALLANLSDRAIVRPEEPVFDTLIWGEPPPKLPPWSVHLGLE